MTKPRFDIRQYKRNLRLHYKEKRRAMDPEIKEKRDDGIRRRLLGMPQYRRAKTLLCFVSMPIEVDTRRIIETALAQGKEVAVPYCVENSRKMRFYLISSLEELVPRTFGVLEPDPAKCRRLTEFTGTICVLPGLCFDQSGYRLGYGGGYYDRFLSKKYIGGTTVGICYSSCVRKNLIHGRFDVPCDYLVTERSVRRIREKRPQSEKN